MDSFRDTIFIRFVLWIRFVTHFNETNESWRILANLYYINVLWMEVKDSRILLLFKRFVSWIRFVLRCSKYSFCGFDSYYSVQKVRFVDSFCKTKNSKLLNLFRFGSTNPASLMFLPSWLIKNQSKQHDLVNNQFLLSMRNKHNRVPQRRKSWKYVVRKYERWILGLGTILCLEPEIFVENWNLEFKSKKFP